MTVGEKRYLDEYGRLVASLNALGFKLVKYSEEPRAFDNFYADFSDGRISFRIVRDRSQLILDGDKEVLEPHGLWQAFDDRETFEKQLLSWLRREA